VDLSTTYLGLKLKHPLVPSSSPLMRNRLDVRRLEDAGAAAIVLHSLFEEQITLESETLDRYLTEGSESFAEAVSYFPGSAEYKTGPEAYLEHISWAKQALDIPVIASLNGVSTGGWVRYAREMQEAGADALELNIYYLPTDLALNGSEVEQIYLGVLKDVKAAIDIPVAMKLSPYFSAMANMADRLAGAGANGLVLFNRFYQPDQSSLELIGRTASTAAMDRDSLRPHPSGFGAHHRRTYGRRRYQRGDGRREGNHAGLRVAHEWHSSHQRITVRFGVLAICA
jgi:dihydroorotate dehydrogenase (fumarate)